MLLAVGRRRRCGSEQTLGDGRSVVGIVGGMGAETNLLDRTAAGEEDAAGDGGKHRW